MPATNDPLTTLAQLTEKIAQELAFAEPGKDNGLLPVNALLSEIEDAARKASLVAPLAEALARARKIVDRVLEKTRFEAETLRDLSDWVRWIRSALPAAQLGRSFPTLPIPADAVAAPVAKATAGIETGPAPDEQALVLNIENDGELLCEFINESHEHLQNIELGVLTLEENPTDADTLASIFRAFHTFKGGSGFLNLTPIKNLAHELESLLDLARNRKLAITSAVINVILEGGDTLKKFVAEIEAQISGRTAPAPIVIPTQGLLADVRILLGSPAATEANRASPTAPESKSLSEPFLGSFDLQQSDPHWGHEPAPNLSQEGNSTKRPIPLVGGVRGGSTSGRFMESAGDPPVPSGDSPALPISKTTATRAPVPPVGPSRAKSAPAAASEVKSGGAGVVKVDTQKLDSLIDLVGEMVIAQSLITQDPDIRSLTSQQTTRNLAQLGRITNDLQRTAMSLRMVPIRATFQKMTRLVRDVAAKQQKHVELTMGGEETELDRNLVEEINDPLVHMIRNAVDHGIEKPEVRRERGKPPEGNIHLSAFHQSGNIVILIKDDGGGLNKDRLLRTAIEKGLVKEGGQLSEKEIFNLIFAPGFSTAEVITEISGRGVGMDVVRRNIEKLRGKIDIQSTPGVGSTFTIYLPLTLAIIDGLVVRVGRERFILPTLSVRESFRPSRDMLSTVHERGEMVNVRGKISPLLRLHQCFDIKPRSTDPCEGIVVVVDSGNENRCVFVDDLVGKQEVVIKSLGETFKRNRALAGAAILGDGSVGLILDADALVKLKLERTAEAA